MRLHQKPSLWGLGAISFKNSYMVKAAVVILMLWAVWAGSLFYINHALQKWAAQQELEVSVRSLHFYWFPMAFPGITFRDVKVRNKDARASVHHFYAKHISIQPDFLASLRQYFKEYKLDVKIENIKIIFSNKDFLESDRAACTIECKKEVYQIPYFMVEPVRLTLGPASTTPLPNGKPNPQGAHLILYQVKGEAEYQEPGNQLKLGIEAPPASLQMPSGKTYAIEGKGNLKFLDTPSKGKDDPGVRGEIKFTIYNLPNFLRHLYQARLISNLVKNLGEIIGHFLSYEVLFVHQKEMDIDPVTLSLTFQKSGLYIGPVKI